MFKKKKTNFQIDTLIDKNMTINGGIKVKGGLRLDGKIYGDLTFSDQNNGSIIIGEDGLVQGNLCANIAIIAGKIEGKIKCTDFLEIDATAIIDGDIDYNIIEIHSGAQIKGRLNKISNTVIGKKVK